ncbi:MAG: TolC family protein [Verrucomicrobia bacterium]|nr:MAG: TolC family protein [Verrucomicrobiota bacterium]
MFPSVKRFARRGLLAGLSFLLALTSCTSSHYRKSADRETYSTIKKKSASVRNSDPHFTIEQTNVISLEGFPTATNAPDFLGIDGKAEIGARILKLEDALDIAIKHSRAYQARKEQLYLSGLSLTLVRHQFEPIFSASGSANYSGRTEQAVTLGIDEITGQPKVIVSDTLVEQQRISGSGAIGASWLIRDVGRVTTAMTTDFLRFVTGDPRVTSSSQLSATFLRPLLRDSGFKTQTEALIQAERQMLYDLREFTRYRKDFSVQIATAYYGVLGSRDTVRNSFLNLQTSRKNAERTRALAAEGRVTTADLGRLEQQELSTESTWIAAIRGYKQSLDNFKILLGLSVDTNLILDDHELDILQIRHPEIAVDDSIKVALAARLDFMNTKDQLDDTERRVKLAENLLKPRVDLAASVAVNSNPNESGHFSLPELDRYRWNAGLNIDPGLDRVAERNSYRAALITRNSAARALVQREDEIKLQVRDSWRTLDQAKRSYEISEIGVKISERRVEEQNLLGEFGRSKAQDLVDAQNALIDAKNLRTQALVTHTIARLQFWNNMGILYIKDNGQWEETEHAKAQ